MDTTVWLVAHAVLGLVVGSFLNVLILRSGTGYRLGGRSGCFSCKHTLRWYELIPVFSWIAQGGRCRQCGSRISVQYPLVETATAILFVVVASLDAPFFLHIGSLAMVSILVALAAYDIRHTILPDLWVYSFAAVALAVGILSLPSGATAPDVAALFFAGLFLALPIAALWFVSNGEWIGLGDAKLMIGIGWLLGPTAGFHALVGAFVIGAVVSLAVLVPLPSYRRVWRKVMHATSLSANGAHFTMKSEVPFGPFLIASCLIVWFLEAHGVTVQYAAFNILY